MDDQRHDEYIEKEETGYSPRPAWQVWAARIGLGIFLAFLVMYYINIFRGGL